LCETSLVLPYVFILILFCLEKTELCTQEVMANPLAPQDLQDLWVLLGQGRAGQDQVSHQVILEHLRTPW